MLSKKTITVATVCGGAAFLVAFLLNMPIVSLIPFPVGGGVSVIFYRQIFRQGISLRSGAMLGLQAGLVASMLTAIGTVVVTGIRTIEFAAAVTFIPVVICVLSILGACVAAFFLRSDVPAAKDG